jgi:hypothetical protein
MHWSDWIGAHRWWRGGWGAGAARIDLRGLVNIWRFAIALSLVLAAAIEASPTTFVKMSLEQLSSATPVIVRGRCQGSMVSAVRGEIWTITSFEVREVWKGNAPAVLRVRLLGGRTAEFTSHVEGVPRFRAGEDLVLFLAPLRRGDYSVAGWAQGTFRISRGGAEAPLVVTQDTVSFLPGAFAGGVAGRGADGGAVRGVPLEEFRRRVVELLAKHQ